MPEDLRATAATTKAALRNLMTILSDDHEDHLGVSIDVLKDVLPHLYSLFRLKRAKYRYVTASYVNVVRLL